MDTEIDLQIRAMGFLMQIEVDWVATLIRKAKKPGPQAHGRRPGAMTLQLCLRTPSANNMVTVETSADVETISGGTSSSTCHWPSWNAAWAPGTVAGGPEVAFNSRRSDWGRRGPVARGDQMGHGCRQSRRTILDASVRFARTGTWR